jgi:ankyrin repeat protein
MTTLYDKFKILLLNDKFTVYKTFNDACKKNDMESIRYLTKLEHFRDLVHPYLGDGFISAVILNHLEVVKYLLTEPGLTVNVPIGFQNNDALNFACQKGNIDMVRYLLTSPDLKKNADINGRADEALCRALRFNNVEVLDYLLTSPELTKHSDIDAAFLTDSDKGYYEIFQEFSFKVEDFTQDDKLFMMVHHNNALENLNYLIFTRNIPKTATIEKILKHMPSSEVEYKFELREINAKLNEELPSNESSRRTKI